MRSSARRPRNGEASRLVTLRLQRAPRGRRWAAGCAPAGRRTAASRFVAVGHLAVGRLDRYWPRRRGPRRRAIGQSEGVLGGLWASSSRSDARSSSRSWLSSTTSAMRASGRSVLLTTRITGRCAASALRSTKRVCGSGPSDASTSSTTPSTMDSPRSTSPPKSAWPGVSMTLMTSRCRRRDGRCTAVFLARIVMPFSRSRSPESIDALLASSPRCVNAPDCRSIASTRVVLPWSTCATMATLRKSTLVIVAVRSAEHENERCPSLEAKQARRSQAQEEVLSQPAALQTVSGGRSRCQQGRTQRVAGQGADKSVQARSTGPPNLSLCPTVSRPDLAKIQTRHRALTVFAATVAVTRQGWLGG